MLRDGQANHPSILDVPGAAVNGLLGCVCLDHRALRVGTVKDVSVQGRHEPLVRPHLVQAHGCRQNTSGSLPRGMPTVVDESVEIRVREPDDDT